MWVKEGSSVSDLECIMFDHKAEKGLGTDPGPKSLPFLSLEDFADGMSDNPDVNAVLRLSRIRPILMGNRLDF